MKKTLVGVVCVVILIVVALRLLGSGREGSTIRAGEGPAERSATDGEPTTLQPPGDAGVPRTAPRSEDDGTEEPVPDGSAERATKVKEEEPEPAHLYGHIVDSHGNRLAAGTILLFVGSSQGPPVARADIEGAEREFHLQLPAGKVHYAMVDPRSVEGFGVPPLVRGAARSRRDDDGALLLDEYFRARIVLEPGEMAWRDFPISALGSVTGRVSGEGGEPLVGVVARVDGTGPRTSGNEQDAKTDRDGAFHFQDLHPGAYRLIFWRPEAHESFLPPLPTDFELAEGEAKDLGEIRTQRGTCVVRGKVVDQDGRPFPGLPVVCYPGPSGGDTKAHGLGDVIRRARTDEDGAFELDGLPAGPLKISLTPGYEPRKVVPDQPAFWELPLDVHPTRERPSVDVGVHVAQKSRPFKIEGRLLEQVPGSYEGRLIATVSDAEDPPFPEGVRRATMQRAPVTMDWETGTFLVLVETPRFGVELRFELDDHQDLVFSLTPEPLSVWTQDISLPGDFQ